MGRLSLNGYGGGGKLNLRIENGSDLLNLYRMSVAACVCVISAGKMKCGIFSLHQGR